MALNSQIIINSIKESSKSEIRTRLGNRVYHEEHLDPEGDGYADSTRQVPVTVANRDINDVIDEISDVLIEKICNEIISHITTMGQITITTGVLGNGGATAGFGGPAAAVIITGTTPPAAIL